MRAKLAQQIVSRWIPPYLVGLSKYMEAKKPMTDTEKYRTDRIRISKIIDEIRTLDSAMT